MSRKLLTKTRLAELRGPNGSQRMLDSAEADEVLSAYETAVRLLEEVVRANGHAYGVVTAEDVAWLALRDSER